MNPIKFAKECWNELKKSSWLTRQQAGGSTAVVVVLVALMAAYVKAVDVVLSIVMGAVLSR
ncbi:MAG TPA: preprotein translocase subunit SecE [Elusimicrobiota bacterium]|jgi:preprotein translocase SecE subunit|nr:preprotein translocase subunit SecE [Elusimicrobiota bacterium]